MVVVQAQQYQLLCDSYEKRVLDLQLEMRKRDEEIVQLNAKIGQ